MRPVLSTPTYFVLSRALTGVCYTAVFSFSAVYRVVVADLTPLQLVLVGTTLELTILMAELPTGIVADLRSRRLSVAIGYMLIGSAFLLEGAVAMFPVILAAQVLWGIGFTFTSGAKEAWLADDIGESAAAPIYLRSSQAYLAGALAGAGLGIALALTNLRLPFFVAGVALIALGAVTRLFVPERGFMPAPAQSRNPFRNAAAVASTAAGIVRGRPNLRLLMLTGVMFGLWSEGFDRLWELHLLEDIGLPALASFDSVAWFGVLNAAALVLALGATEIVRRMVDLRDVAATLRALTVLCALLTAALAGFAAATSFAVATSAFLAVKLTVNACHPLFAAWANRDLPSEVRATVLSARGQADSLGQFTGGPLIGYVAGAAGVPCGIALAAMLLSPIVPVLERARRLHRR